jgi:hypothetical protein
MHTILLVSALCISVGVFLIVTVGKMHRPLLKWSAIVVGMVALLGLAYFAAKAEPQFMPDPDADFLKIGTMAAGGYALFLYLRRK